jgi:TusA-related sulfurtransferase
MSDFPAWAKTSVNEIVKTEQEDKVIREPDGVYV